MNAIFKFIPIQTLFMISAALLMFANKKADKVLNNNLLKIILFFLNVPVIYYFIESLYRMWMLNIYNLNPAIEEFNTGFQQIGMYLWTILLFIFLHLTLIGTFFSAITNIVVIPIMLIYYTIKYIKQKKSIDGTKYFNYINDNLYKIVHELPEILIGFLIKYQFKERIKNIEKEE